MRKGRYAALATIGTSTKAGEYVPHQAYVLQQRIEQMRLAHPEYANRDLSPRTLRALLEYPGHAKHILAIDDAGGKIASTSAGTEGKTKIFFRAKSGSSATFHICVLAEDDVPVAKINTCLPKQKKVLAVVQTTPKGRPITIPSRNGPRTIPAPT